jgi:hypothetical protein
MDFSSNTRVKCSMFLLDYTTPLFLSACKLNSQYVTGLKQI